MKHERMIKDSVYSSFHKTLIWSIMQLLKTERWIFLNVLIHKDFALTSLENYITDTQLQETNQISQIDLKQNQCNISDTETLKISLCFVDQLTSTYSIRETSKKKLNRATVLT